LRNRDVTQIGVVFIISFLRSLG